MKNVIRKGVIIIIGTLLNILGSYVALSCNMPIWLDTIGIFLVSYFLGIFGGVFVGVLQSFILGIFDITTLAYLPVRIVIAIVAYIFVKRGYMENVYKALASSFWMGVICTVISTPINIILFEGYTGNEWGDTLVDMLRWYDIDGIWASLAGQVVVEIVDKQVCVLIAYLVIYIMKKVKKRKSGVGQLVSVGLIFCIVISLAYPGYNARAGEIEEIDNNFIDFIYNNTNGMVSSEANTICETEDGYIWIGSYAGLTRYDGNEFEFIREGGLVNVVGMMRDNKGRLWIGTNDAGIARYEDGEYTYFTEKEGLPSNSVRCFAQDTEGNVYVGTSDKICMFSPDDTIITLKYDITFAKSMIVYNDILVIADNNGSLHALNNEKRLSINITDELKDDFFFNTLAITSKGLMVGTETGEIFVLKIDAESVTVKEKINISADEITALFEDGRQRIWVATESGFGYIDKLGNYNKMYYEEFASSIVCFHEDYQGNIWIASSRYGVMKLTDSKFVNLFRKTGIDNKVVNAVINYKGDYYCGTDEGLLVLDGKSFNEKEIPIVETIGNCRIRALFEDYEERLWICTYDGLICYGLDDEIHRYNPQEHGVTSERFRCITQLKDNTIVAGTADGINFIKNDEIKKTFDSKNGLGNTQILTLAEGYDGSVWAGSDGSGIYVISDGKIVKTYTTEDGLSSNVILRIVPYDNGYFVVTSNALCHIGKNGKAKRLSNFPYFNNYDIIIKDEIAYVTCSAGMYKIPVTDLRNDNMEQIKLYGANEGLLSGFTANSWNYISSEGNLFLCSNNGVIVYNDCADESQIKMKYDISSVECDGREVEVSANKYLLPSDAENISLYARVKNYSFTDIKVKFYIKELDDNPKVYNWNEIEPITIFKSDFTKYHVCLQILDSSGEKVLEEKEYIISKQNHAWERPVYKTYLFLVVLEIVIFTIINIVILVHFVLRKNELEKVQVELERRVNEQTGELRFQQKKMKRLFVQTVTALSEAVDAKDRYTSGHSKRVAEYSRMIAARMGKSKQEQEEIYRAGLLHDVGKIRVPAEIINKSGKLTDEEYNIIKIHPVTGYHILKGISEDNFIAIAAKYHHERYDGKGYPNGLTGERIPEVARILGVADAYDAMASNRSYRKALPQEVVRSEIEKGRGSQFDPYIADIMLQMIEEDKMYEMKQIDSMHRRILIIDDDMISNKIIMHMMEDEPMYEIDCACGCNEALKMIEAKSYDLILLDVNMPEINGLETLKLIRKRVQTPVVLITSDKTLDTSIEFEGLGCDDYITKPFLPLMIKEVIYKMSERPRIDN